MDERKCPTCGYVFHTRADCERHVSEGGGCPEEPRRAAPESREMKRLGEMVTSALRDSFAETMREMGLSVTAATVYTTNPSTGSVTVTVTVRPEDD